MVRISTRTAGLVTMSTPVCNGPTDGDFDDPDNRPNGQSLRTDSGCHRRHRHDEPLDVTVKVANNPGDDVNTTGTLEIFNRQPEVNTELYSNHRQSHGPRWDGRHQGRVIGSGTGMTVYCSGTTTCPDATADAFDPTMLTLTAPGRGCPDILVDQNR